MMSFLQINNFALWLVCMFSFLTGLLIKLSDYVYNIFKKQQTTQFHRKYVLCLMLKTFISKLFSGCNAWPKFFGCLYQSGKCSEGGKDIWQVSTSILLLSVACQIYQDTDYGPSVKCLWAGVAKTSTLSLASKWLWSADRPGYWSV